MRQPWKKTVPLLASGRVPAWKEAGAFPRCLEDSTDLPPSHRHRGQGCFSWMDDHEGEPESGEYAWEKI